jgi:hypothetical protein
MLPKPDARTADTDTARAANGTTKMRWSERKNPRRDKPAE